MNRINISLSENIRLLRERKGYSQYYVAKRMKITQQAYSSIEKKPENLTLKRLEALCVILEIDVVTLLTKDLKIAGVTSDGLLQKTQEDSALPIIAESHAIIKLIQDLTGEIHSLRSEIRKRNPVP